MTKVESQVYYDYECIKSFMGTDDFRNVSTFYGLDSQIIANCLKAFASYLDIPKKEWNKYHAPYKNIVNCVPPRNIEVHTVDPIVPEPYIDKMPFPAKVKEHSIITSVVNKSARKPVEPEEQITVEPIVAIVKDLVSEM